MFKFNFKLDPKSDSDSNSNSHSDSNSSSCNFSSDDESIEIVNSIVEEIISRIVTKKCNFKVELNSAPIIFGAKEDITSQKGYKFDAYSALPNSFNFGSNLPITFAPVFETKLQTASSDPTDEANEVVNSLTEEMILK